LKMNESGILHCYYIVEENKELHDKTILVV